jgi:SAM-dependent methyltransferase
MLAGVIQPKLQNNICIDLNAALLEIGKNYLQRNYYPFAIHFIHGDIFKNGHLFAQADLAYHYVAFNRAGIHALIQQWTSAARPGAKLILVDDAEREKLIKQMDGFELNILNNMRRHIYSHHLTFILTKK